MVATTLSLACTMMNLWIINKLGTCTVVYFMCTAL